MLQNDFIGISFVSTRRTKRHNDENSETISSRIIRNFALIKGTHQEIPVFWKIISKINFKPLNLIFTENNIDVLQRSTGYSGEFSTRIEFSEICSQFKRLISHVSRSLCCSTISLASDLRGS